VSGEGVSLDPTGVVASTQMNVEVMNANGWKRQQHHHAQDDTDHGMSWQFKFTAIPTACH